MNLVPGLLEMLNKSSLLFFDGFKEAVWSRQMGTKVSGFLQGCQHPLCSVENENTVEMAGLGKVMFPSEYFL